MRCKWMDSVWKRHRGRPLIENVHEFLAIDESILLLWFPLLLPVTRRGFEIFPELDQQPPTRNSFTYFGFNFANHHPLLIHLIWCPLSSVLATVFNCPKQQPQRVVGGLLFDYLPQPTGSGPFASVIDVLICKLLLPAGVQSQVVVG